MAERSNFRVLVFGAEGQLGSELIRQASAAAMQPFGFSRSEADIADRHAVSAALATVGPDLVVNTAAFTRVDDAEVERTTAHRVNAEGPGIVAEACNAAGIGLIHVSTDYVFDGSKMGAYTEEDPVAPCGFYGQSKAEGENAVRKAAARHLILRTSWLYGAFGNNFLRTMFRLASQRDEIGVVNDQHGCPTSTRDLAHAIVRIAPQLPARADLFGTYHFAGDGVTTWFGFADAAVARYNAISNRNVVVRPISTSEYPTRTKRPANSALDCSKFERIFGFRGKPWRAEVEEIADMVAQQMSPLRSGEGERHA